jgi:hypothetical protein
MCIKWEEVRLISKYGRAKCLEMIKESINRFTESDDVWSDGSLAQLYVCSEVLQDIVRSYDPNWHMLNEQIEDIYERTGITDPDKA